MTHQAGSSGRGRLGNDQGRDWTELALAQYKSHREEILVTIQGRQRTAAFGATAVAFLVAGAFHVWDDRVLASLAFLIVIPVVSFAVLTEWTGNILATERVGAYLTALEHELRGAYLGIPTAVARWEEALGSLRGASSWTPNTYWHETAVPTIFLTVTAASMSAGGYHLYSGHAALVVVVVVVEAVLMAAGAIVMAWELGTSRRRVRDRLLAAVGEPVRVLEPQEFSSLGDDPAEKRIP